jgi:hypothetical protein
MTDRLRSGAPATWKAAWSRVGEALPPGLLRTEVMQILVDAAG